MLDLFEGLLSWNALTIVGVLSGLFGSVTGYRSWKRLRSFDKPKAMLQERDTGRVDNKLNTYLVITNPSPTDIVVNRVQVDDGLSLIKAGTSSPEPGLSVPCQSLETRILVPSGQTVKVPFKVKSDEHMLLGVELQRQRRAYAAAVKEVRT